MCSMIRTYQIRNSLLISLPCNCAFIISVILVFAASLPETQRGGFTQLNTKKRIFHLILQLQISVICHNDWKEFRLTAGEEPLPTSVGQNPLSPFRKRGCIQVLMDIPSAWRHQGLSEWWKIEILLLSTIRVFVGENHMNNHPSRVFWILQMQKKYRN